MRRGKVTSDLLGAMALCVHFVLIDWSAMRIFVTKTPLKSIKHRWSPCEKKCLALKFSSHLIEGTFPDMVSPIDTVSGILMTWRSLLTNVWKTNRYALSLSKYGLSVCPYICPVNFTSEIRIMRAKNGGKYATNVAWRKLLQLIL